MFFIKPTRKTLFLFVFFLLCFVASLIMSTSVFNSFAIETVQKLTGKVLRDPYKWSCAVYNCVHMPLFVSIVLLFLKFTFIGNSICESKGQIYKKFGETFAQKKNIIFSLLLVVFFFIAYYKIINADFYYMDDMARNMGADDSGWMAYGRYISEFGSVLVHGSFPLTDIGPLSQIISVIIFAFTVFTLSYIICGNDIRILPTLGLSLLFISPFFSQCFSYRYDNPYMTLSILFAILPFLFCEDKKSFIYTSIIFLILSCMSYQAGTSVYVVVCMYLVLKKIINGKKENIVSFIIISVISFALALVIYQLLFNCSGNPKFSKPEDVGLASTGFSVSRIIPNLKIYSSFVLKNFGGHIFKLCFIITLLMFVILNIVKSKVSKLVSFFVLAIFIVAGFILSLGAYLVFEASMIAPRVLMGFNCFVSLIVFDSLFMISEKTQKFRKILFVPAILCVYLSVAFLYTYGNCLTQQKDYSDFRMHALIYDLSEYISTESKEVKVSLNGSAGYCKSYDNARRQYPILNSLVMRFPGSNMWDKDYAYKFNFIFEDAYVSEVPSDFMQLKDSKLHTIFASPDRKIFYVELRE